MALIRAEGFDDLSNATDLAYRVTAIFGSAGVVTGRKGTGKALYTDGNYADITYSRTNVTDPVIMGFAYWLEAFDPWTAREQWFRVLGPSGGRVCEFAVGNVARTSLAYLRLYDSTNTLVSTFPGFKGIDSYIEFKLTTGTTGHITVKLDGVQVYDADGNFKDGASNGVTGWQIQTSGNVDSYLDDIYWCDNTGTYNNNFLGDVQVLSAPPTADGFYSEMTPSTPGDHWAMVDEYPIDGDTSYVDADAIGERDTYLFPDKDASIGDLLAVQFIMYSRLVEGASGELTGLIRKSSTDYLGTAKIVQSVYQGPDNIYEVDPATTVPWTVAGLNACEFGMKKTG